MDYREELLNRIMIDLCNADIDNLDIIKQIMIKNIGQYSIAERCTELAILDDSNERIIKLFLTTKKIEGGSNETAKTRWFVLRSFINDVNKPFSEIQMFDILNWLVKEQSRVRLSTAETYRTILASLFNWMFENGFITTNPMKNIKPIKFPNSIKKSFTAVEIDALKTACKDELDRAMVELLLSSGLRCEELCNLKWEDVNFTSKDVNVIEGKGNKNRITMMDDVTRKYLIEYKNSLNYDSEYVFAVRYRGEIKPRSTDSVWRRLKDIGNRAGVEEVNPHKFRHTFATILWKRGLDMRMIQRLLGHTNINTTMIYIDSNVEMLRDAYKKCI